MMMKRFEILYHDRMNNDETLQTNRSKNRDQKILKNDKLVSQFAQRSSSRT